MKANVKKFLILCSVLLTPGYQPLSLADNTHPVDVCDFESVGALLKQNFSSNQDNPNDGSMNQLTDKEEKQSSRNKAYFSSTKKAEDCLKQLEKAGKFYGPNGAFVEAVRDKEPKNGKKDEELFKFRWYANENVKGNWVELKVKKDKDGNETFLKKGMFDRTFSYKDRESKDGGFLKGKEKFQTARFCGTKNWKLEKLEKEKKQCDDKFKTHTWDEVACECNPDSNKLKPCPNGKSMTDDDKLAAKTKCEAPNSNPNSKKFYEYDMDKCECEDTPKVHDCGPNFGTVGIREYERKKKYCEILIKIDPRRSWREASCDCPPVPKEKPKPEFCGKIKLKHPGHKEELRQKCLKKYNEESAWNGSDCTCTDPCYEYIPNKGKREEKCDLTIMTIQGEWLGEVTGKVCEQPYDNQRVIDELKKDAIAYCKGQVVAEMKNFEDGRPTNEFDKTYTTKYTHPTGVVCSTSVVNVGSDAKVGEFFPDNVPTFDLEKFSGTCESGYTLNDPKLGVYRIHDGQTKQDILGCSDGADNDYENIKKGNQELKSKAEELVKKYMDQLNLSKPVSKAQLDEALKNAKINLNVMGTANRNNNNTSKTLEELANMRKSEAERLMIDEIKKQFGSYLGDGNGAYSISDDVFVKKGVSKPVGPLSPEYPYSGSYGEVCDEKGELLKDCCAKYRDPFKGTELYKCSVSQFFDKECPALLVSNPDLHSRVCSNAEERKNKYLNAMKGGFFDDGRAKVDPAVLDDFNALKLFDVSISIEAPDKKVEENDNPTLSVTCNGKVGPETTTVVNDIPIYNLELKKPGILRRLKKDCRNEKKLIRKDVDSQFGEGTFKKLMKEGTITVDAPEGK